MARDDDDDNGSRQDDVESPSIKEMAYGERRAIQICVFVCCDEMIDCVLLLSRVASWNLS